MGDIWTNNAAAYGANSWTGTPVNGMTLSGGNTGAWSSTYAYTWTSINPYFSSATVFNGEVVVVTWVNQGTNTLNQGATNGDFEFYVGNGNTISIGRRTLIEKVNINEVRNAYQPSACTSDWTPPPETTAPPLTDCEEAPADAGAEETLEEVLCLCDEFRTDGWSWERNALTSRLVSQMENLREAGGPISNDSPKFLQKWNRRINFSLFHHETNDDNTVNNVYDHRRMWRKVCRNKKVKEDFLRKAAEKIDNMN